MLVIGIAGGSGSGKTTVVNAITHQLKERVVVIPQDSYYKDSSYLPLEERQKINFDHPDAIDFKLLCKQLRELKEGKSIEQPVYSYITCSRSKTETITVEPADVIIIEGILVFTCKELRDQMDIKIFVDADDDDRLMRVMARDIIERGKTVETVIERYTKTVKPMYLQFIDDKAGLYLTVIFHLVILIVLLIAQIGFSLQKENSFVIDFTKQEEIEAREKKQRFDEEVEKKVDDLIAAKVDRMLAGMSGVEFRNTTTSRNKGALKDDRNTDAEKLYADAEKLAKDLKNGPKAELCNDDFVETPSKTQKKDDKASDKTYSGPSVLSWHLDNRKASHLPIPAYRCYGGGMVTVVITVNNAGKVVDARVLDEVSSDDKCLRDFAIRAARMSIFSSSPTAPSKQTGDIIYQFIAQ